MVATTISTIFWRSITLVCNKCQWIYSVSRSKLDLMNIFSMRDLPRLLFWSSISTKLRRDNMFNSITKLELNFIYLTTRVNKNFKYIYSWMNMLPSKTTSPTSSKTLRILEYNFGRWRLRFIWWWLFTFILCTIMIKAL